MQGYVTFDTINSDSDQNNIEGCYRVSDEDWKVYYFTHCFEGKIWYGEPIITENAKFPSGILGIDVVLSGDRILNNETVISILAKILKVDKWSVVLGPDSLNLK